MSVKSPHTPLLGEFLSAIWAPVEPQAYVFVATKDWSSTGAFRERGFRAVAIKRNPRLPEDDLYFCPNTFAHKKRQRSSAQGKTPWLHADLDEVDPYGIDDDLRPQIAWETSPGRYQCLWRLDEPLGPRAMERLNKSLTYHLGADKGGWSWNKYLRVPGSTSHKHAEPFTVRVLWFEAAATIAKADLQRRVKDTLAPSDASSGRIYLPKATGAEIARKRWNEIPGRARGIIRAKAPRPGDDRSARLWDLYTDLSKAGFTPGEMVRIAQDTCYNKFRGQRREVRALWTEAKKAYDMYATHVEPEPAPRRNGRVLPKVDFSDIPPNARAITSIQEFMSLDWPKPSWLVKGVWTEGAYGYWAGEFKSYKTTMLLDLAVSVATGQPFLGKFEVAKPGKVLYIHEEGRPGEIHTQLHRILGKLGMAPVVHRDGTLDLGKDLTARMDICSLQGFDLSDPEDLVALDFAVKTTEPVLVILETFYVLAPGVDHNDGAEVTAILSALSDLALKHRTAVIISHHYSKRDDDSRAGIKVTGSNAWNFWYESRVLAERVGDEQDHTVRFQADHRAFDGTSKQDLTFDMEENTSQYELTFIEGDRESVVDLESVPPKPTLNRKPRKDGKRAYDRYPDGPVPAEHPSGPDDASMDGLLEDLVPGELMLLSDVCDQTGLKDWAVKTRVEKSSTFQLVKRNGRRYVLKH